MDPSQANTGTALQTTLLFGQMLAAGTAVPDHPLIVASAADVLAAAGQGSFLAAMATRYLERDTFGPLYIVPLVDNPAGVAAAGSITVAGTASASGTLNVYIAGVRIQVGVAAADAAAAVAAKLNTAINANLDLPVTSTAPAAVVQIVCRHKGELGNDIQLIQNYLGSAGGEYPVPGVTLTIAPMTGGTANPLLSNGIAALSSSPFDFIGMPFTDTVSLNAMKAFLADDVGRWSWQQMVYGGCFSAFRGTLGACTAFGLARNDQHMSVIAFNGSPDPSYIWTAEITASCAASLRGYRCNTSRRPCRRHRSRSSSCSASATRCSTTA
jgi:phage tail sheath gpL-like